MIRNLKKYLIDIADKSALKDNIKLACLPSPIIMFSFEIWKKGLNLSSSTS